MLLSENNSRQYTLRINDNFVLEMLDPDDFNKPLEPSTGQRVTIMYSLVNAKRQSLMVFYYR